MGFRTSLLSAQIVLVLPLLAIDNVDDDSGDDPHAPPAPRLEPRAVIAADSAADGPESTSAPTTTAAARPATLPTDAVEKAQENRRRR